MAANIFPETATEAGDLGFVNGTTWHGLPQYTVLDRPPTYEEAELTADYEVKKEGLIVPAVATAADTDGVSVTYPALTVEAWALVRQTPKRTVVHPSVGRAYTVCQNMDLLRSVKERLLDASQGKIQIDSCGTLLRGGKWFVNVAFEAFQVQGDSSKNCTKILLYNNHGSAMSGSGGHTTRVVCDNTLRSAVAEAFLNGSLVQCVHRANIGTNMEDALIELGKVHAGLGSFQTTEQAWYRDLASTGVQPGEVVAFIEHLVPIPEDATKVLKDNRQTQRQAILSLIETDGSMTQELKWSWYGVLQGVTAYADAPRKGFMGDKGTSFWSGLFGEGDKLKQLAVSLIPVKHASLELAPA